MKLSRIKTPRLTIWLVASIVLALLAYFTRQSDPLLSITFYKAHLMSLGGWGGYWLDRLIFPYARPHEFVDDCDVDGKQCLDGFQAASLRRAIVVAASLICVGLAA